MNEIRSALHIGKEVTTHSDPITASGWRGSGYIILDPIVGDGAYLISGGLNGGSQSILDGILFMVAGALGFTDGATGQHLGKRYSSNLPRLQYLSKLAKVSAGLGFLASFVSIYQAFTNDSLSLSQKLVRHQQLF